jgi:hypothetical protein
MQKLTILLILLFPLGLWAQSSSPIKTAHQQAEQKLMAQHPQAQKVDIAQLTEKQKDLHKTPACKSCGAKNKTLKSTTTSKAVQRNLAQLKAEQEGITTRIKTLEAESNANLGLLEKYNTVLTRNKQQIKLAENRLKTQKKLNKQ